MSFLLQHGPALAIAVPLFAAFSTTLIGKLGGKARDAWVILGLLFAEAAAGALLLDVLANGIRVYTLGAALPSLTAPAGFPIRIVLAADAASALVATAALSIALIAAVYSLRSMQQHTGLEKFYSLLLLLTAGIAGIAFTGDFFTLFVFVEIVSISSAGLIAFFCRGEGFEAAFKYMVISAIGALILLFGVGLLYGQHGLLNMAAVAEVVAGNVSFADVAALTLVTAALLLKAGAFPVHMWKPDAYQEAPSQVAVMLVVSSLACLYALFRICFMFFGVAGLGAVVGWAVAVLGALSIFVGVTMALAQNNIKRMIGYAAVAEVGYVMLAAGIALTAMPNLSGFALGALSGGIFQLLNDALDLGLLFLASGAILYITKKQQFDGISGLGHSSPELAGLFLIGLLAISGMPPFNGFAGKLLIYESVYYSSPVLAVVGIVGSIMLLAIFVKAFSSVFLGTPYRGKVQRLPKSMLAAMCVLALFIVLFGLFPGAVLDAVVAPAAEALANPGAYIGGIL